MEANICRFCRHEFEEVKRTPEAYSVTVANKEHDESNAYKGFYIVGQDDGKFVVQDANGTRVSGSKLYRMREDAKVAIDVQFFIRRQN